MLNFTVGPVMMPEGVKRIGGEDIPYFRTEEFSQVMFENERLLKKAFFAPENAKAVFLTASGTGAMEAAIINAFTAKDRVLIVNGGSFGQRLVDICQIHAIPYTEIKLPLGKALTSQDLSKYEKTGYTGFLVQACETSTGIRFDLKLISDFCKRNNLFFIVDAISGFLADPMSMSDLGIDVIMTGSQKALATAPGIALLVLDEKAIQRAKEINVRSLYFNFLPYLTNMERGQTPFTPAVGTLLELNYQLKDIDKRGVLAVNDEIAKKASYFRNLIKNLPLFLFAETPSNSCTALKVQGKNSAHDIFETIKNRYGIFICPNGGELRDTVFRVGHLGNVTLKDYDTLSRILHEMNDKGEL